MQPSETPVSTSAWKMLFEGGLPADAADANPIQQRALLVNRLAIVLALLANVATMGSFFIIGESVPTQALSLMLMSTVLYIACFELLRRGRTTSSRLAFSVSLLTTVCFLTLSMGTSARVHALYLPIALAGTIVWPRNAVGMVMLGLLGIIGFFGLELFGPANGIADLQVSGETMALMAWFYLGLTVLLCCLVMLLNHLTSIRLQDLLDAEHQKVEGLLLQILPGSVARELLQAGHYTPRRVEDVTVLFADIVGFTSMAEAQPPETIVAMLNDLFCRFDQLVEAHGVEKIKTVGDAYMVIAGAPNHREDHLEAMARFALQMQKEANQMTLPDGTPVRMRIGIHAGSAVAGVVGESRSVYDIWGATVNLASRMESHGEPGRIQVSEKVHARLAATHRLTARGQVHVKNIGPVDTFWLEGDRTESGPPPSR